MASPAPVSSQTQQVNSSGTQTPPASPVPGSRPGSGNPNISSAAATSHLPQPPGNGNSVGNNTLVEREIKPFKQKMVELANEHWASQQVGEALKCLDQPARGAQAPFCITIQRPGDPREISIVPPDPALSAEELQSYREIARRALSNVQQKLGTNTEEEWQGKWNQALTQLVEKTATVTGSPPPVENVKKFCESVLTSSRRYDCSIDGLKVCMRSQSSQSAASAPAQPSQPQPVPPRPPVHHVRPPVITGQSSSDDEEADFVTPPSSLRPDDEQSREDEEQDGHNSDSASSGLNIPHSTPHIIPDDSASAHGGGQGFSAGQAQTHQLQDDEEDCEEDEQESVLNHASAQTGTQTSTTNTHNHASGGSGTEDSGQAEGNEDNNHQRESEEEEESEDDMSFKLFD